MAASSGEREGSLSSLQLLKRRVCGESDFVPEDGCVCTAHRRQIRITMLDGG